MGANDVQLLPGRQSVQLELAAFRMDRDEYGAVGADVDVHGPGGTARIRDYGDLVIGRDVEHLRHDGGRRASPLPRCDRDAVVADERQPLAPGDARVGAVVDAWEGTDLAAGADVPDPDGAIGAERREARAVRAEARREDAATMGAQRVGKVAGRGIPEPRGAVGASCRDEFPVRAVRRRRGFRPCVR